MNSEMKKLLIECKKALKIAVMTFEDKVPYCYYQQHMPMYNKIFKEIDACTCENSEKTALWECPSCGSRYRHDLEKTDTVWCHCDLEAPAYECILLPESPESSDVHHSVLKGEAN